MENTSGGQLSRQGDLERFWSRFRFKSSKFLRRRFSDRRDSKSWSEGQTSAAAGATG